MQPVRILCVAECVLAGQLPTTRSGGSARLSCFVSFPHYQSLVANLLGATLEPTHRSLSCVRSFGPLQLFEKG